MVKSSASDYIARACPVVGFWKIEDPGDPGKVVFLSVDGPDDSNSKQVRG